MKKGNILIALEKLDIGGVETYVYTQAIQLKRMGYNVVILSAKGIYSDILTSKGIQCIEFDFEDKLYYNLEKINKILEIFKKYDIKEVHINQFPAMNVLFPACIISNVPYVVYLHMASGIINDEKSNVYDFYSKTYCTYDENFELLFKYAHKIVAITSTIKDYIIKRYNIEKKEKCIVIPNSIDFEEYNSKKEVDSLKNILIVSRFSEIKMQSITNAIKLYKTLKKSNKEPMTLTIVGDGPKREEIKKYIDDNEIEDVIFTGAKSNVKEYIEANDLVIGLDRCMIEALAMKRLAVISGYDGIKGLITRGIIDEAIKENFCGKDLPDKNMEEIAQQILKLNQDKIKEITEDNYNIINKKLDIKKNIYCIDIEDYKYDIDISEFMRHMVKINYILGTKEEKERNKKEENWKEHIEYQRWIEGQKEILTQENKNLKNEIKNYVNQIENYKNTSEFKRIKEKIKTWAINKTHKLK